MNDFERELEQVKQRRRRGIRMVAIMALAAVAVAVVAALFTVGVYRIDVIIAPSAAVATAVVTVIEGIGFASKTSVWALHGPLTLQVGADGFATMTLAVTAAAKTRQHVDVVLRERLVALRATTDVNEAKTRWFLDGAFVLQGAHLDTELQDGEYILEARHPHYAPASQKVTARRGAAYDVRLSLTPVTGRINLTSEPDAATVTRNGETAGSTPLALDVPGGIHELRIDSDGYTTRTETLQITHAAPTATRHYRLARVRTGVSFILLPDHGVLSVNGQAVSEPDNLRLAVGLEHHVRYTQPGYAPFETTFTLKPGAYRTIELTLAPTFGMVNVQSAPEAEIVVNGTSAGRTPMRLTLQTVPQTIRLTRDGYRAVTRTLTPEPHTEQSLHVTLAPEARAKLDVAPPQYTNGVGIVLKLFRNPGTIILGTPRGERGRRANEFMREVRLTRAFYAGMHEVTAGQYRRFTHPEQPPVVNRHPVTDIAWEDAARFCNWLSQREGFAPMYQFAGGRHVGSHADADGYRLPTEAEWEWLARKAGRRIQTRFPWGNETRVPNGSGNLADESAKGTVPVYIPHYDDGFAQMADIGTFMANDSGLHDLAGNASEWMHDTYDLRIPPADRVETDPLDVEPGNQHTVKGSSWRSGDLGELRAAYRAGSRAPKPELGFRIVRYPGGGS